MQLVQEGVIICNDMHVALGQFIASWFNSRNQIQLSYFSVVQVILGAKVTNVASDVMYFNVDVDGRLWHVYFGFDA